MKKILISTVVLACVQAAFAAAIEQVIVRQQWPWSTDVKVEYKITGIADPVDLSIKAYNGSVELPLPEAAIRGKRFCISEDGVGQFLIDPVAAFGTEKVALANFKVKISVATSSELNREVLYKIFDLEQNTVKDVTRGALLNGDFGAVETSYAAIGAGYATPLEDVLVWTGVTNYPGAKTTKLVMRKIKAGGFTFRKWMKWSDGRVHNMSVSKDFWIGVFECTQKQFSLCNPTHTSDGYCNPVYKGDAQPMENIAALVTLFDLANGVDRLATDPQGTLANIRAKFGEKYAFSLPTQAQWYRAMTAGCTTYYYDGLDVTESVATNGSQMAGLACYNGNRASSAGPCDVGEFRPNAFGLYDMLGNVRETTIDAGNNWNNPSSLVDMANSATGNAFGVFGGSFKCSNEIWPLASYNVNLHYQDKYDDVGFRLYFPDPAAE